MEPLDADDETFRKETIATHAGRVWRRLHSGVNAVLALFRQSGAAGRTGLILGAGTLAVFLLYATAAWPFAPSSLVLETGGGRGMDLCDRGDLLNELWETITAARTQPFAYYNEVCNKCDGHLLVTWGRAVRAGAVRPNPLFLNVGANVGKWALQAIENTPAAVVHSFELIPSTFALLKKAHEEAPEAVRRSWFVHGVGMARKAGQYRILDYGPGAEIGVLYGTEGTPPSAEGKYTVVSVETVAGWMAANLPAGAYVDFLAIDAEGSDGDVVYGTDLATNAHRIGAMMFELGGGWFIPTSNPSNNTLVAVLSHLESHGFECFALGGGSLWRVTPSFWRDAVEWLQGPNIFCPNVAGPYYVPLSVMHTSAHFHKLCHTLGPEGAAVRAAAVAAPVKW